MESFSIDKIDSAFKQNIQQLAQTINEDNAFINEIIKLESEDSKKGDLFRKTAVVLRHIGCFDLSMKTNNKALEYYQLFNDKFGQAYCYSNMCVLADTCFHDNCSAIQYGEKAKAIFDDLKPVDEQNLKKECQVVLSLSHNYYKMGLLHQSLEVAKYGYQKSHAIRDLDIEGRFLSDMAMVYADLGDYDKAINLYGRSLEAAEISNRPVEKGAYFTNVGEVYNKQGRPDEAIEYQEKALGIFGEIGENRGQVYCYIQLSSSYMLLRDFAKAIDSCNQGLSMSIEKGYSREIALCFQQMSTIYYQNNDLAQSKQYTLKALELFEKTKNKLGEAKCRVNLGLSVYNDDKKMAKQQARKAEQLINELEIENYPLGEDILQIVKEIDKGSVTASTLKEFSFLTEKFKK